MTARMHRTQYETVADIIGTGSARLGLNESTTDQLSEFACTRLQTTNPQFDRERFRAKVADLYNTEKTETAERETRDDYNGWTNWDTWSVHLEMTDSPGLYSEFCRMGQADDVEAAVRDIPLLDYVRANVDWDLVDWEEIADAARECAGEDQ